MWRPVLSIIVSGATVAAVRFRTASAPFDCYVSNGADYVGLKDSTSSGRKCKNWMEEGTYPATTEGIGNHRYCRNPDGSKNKPWCFTVDPEVEWELCDVPACEPSAVSPEPWKAPEGSKSEGTAPCKYTPPKNPGFKEYKAGRACMDHRGTKWWLITNNRTTQSDSAGCKSKCSELPGTEYFTFWTGSPDEGNCGCYRECVLVDEDLTTNSPTVYKVD